MLVTSDLKLIYQDAKPCSCMEGSESPIQEI